MGRGGWRGGRRFWRCHSAPENAIYAAPVLTKEAEIKRSGVAPPLPDALSLITALSSNCWVDSWQPAPQRRLEYGSISITVAFYS